MTEKEKMLSGQLYDASDATLVQERHQARLLFQEINRTGDEHKEQRNELFYKLFGSAGEDLWIEPPFYCDYGYNIKLGEKVFMNFNCCILDVMEVNIGNNVLFAPNVHVYTASHPLDAKTRSKWLENAKPVTIGNDVWIGGGAIVCPGVTIGNRVVVGAGSVVTKDVPDDVLVAGNPAQVIRPIDNSGFDET
ncbi:sugar O-acetyltransferase [Reichenbachiella agariperforans]|nr:sugar O-acetyltransferase [Reichenbachiella agariperforans]